MLRGVGVGHRREIGADLLRRPQAVDFVEVLAESCTAPRSRAEARALAEIWPVVVHGVGLSLGSAEGIDPARCQRLGQLARELEARCVTEHVAFARAGGREIGHLTTLPWTREAVSVVARNAARARRLLPDVPLLLENVAWSLRWPEDAMDEGEFYREITRATGCGLLLDVSNLYANARNAGRDPLDALSRLPLERVGMLHVAGGLFEDGYWFDTHAHAVPEEVFALVERALRAIGDVPVVLERDRRFPAFAELEGEIGRLRSMARRDGPGGGSRAQSLEPIAVGAEAGELSRAQAELARALTSELPSSADGARFGGDALARSRRILRGKRVEAALPLLRHLSVLGEDVFRIAVARVDSWPRAPAHPAVVDAMRIAAAAAEHPALARAAATDLLVLEARFVGPDASGAVRPRLGPFVRRAPGGYSGWVVKGFGPEAQVRIWRDHGH